MLEKEDCEAASFFDATQYNPELEKFRELCERVSGYYMVDQYPLFVDLELTSEEIKEDLEEAKEFIQMMFLNESKIDL